MPIEGKIIQHKGIERISYYNNGRVDKDYEPYLNESRVKIYNVSTDSKINTFPKISYNQFYNMLDNNTYNQETLKQDIRNRLSKF